MKSVNSWHGIGNVTRDPEIKYTSQGTAVVKLSIACNEKFKKGDEWQERVEYINIQAWARLAEIVGEYVKKGAPIYIEGSLRTDKWEKEGKTNYFTYINASNIVLLGKSGGSSRTEQTDYTTGAPAGYSNEQLDDDSIPF